ncbi:5'-methylthioadenosine/adenosylhomocysteine nucleosidase [Brevibacillus reuszeri]|uniref:5'-methylthioadenosine/adenosylhomocysteine nucleosidase n=1 Tax=Brevibacillus reuszeri TaxID=54915 RepID=UPI000CCC0E14|nr:5'-methylthioadenosine/adenosylhomocysteine nucleosidase [Brevibacillus reuszeri]
MRIGVIGAMDEELVFLKTKVVFEQNVLLFGLTFEIGVYKGIEVIIVKTGIGKVNAAVGTTLLISQFSPDYIVNVGVAGSFRDNIKIGDVVVASEVRHHDVNVTLFGYEHGQVPELPPSFQADPKLVQLAAQSTLPLVHVGLVVSGDHYFDDHETVDKIRSTFPSVFAAEMEAASIGHVCWMAGVPFLIIRTISDQPGNKGQESFHEHIHHASTTSAELLLKLLEAGL